jgi:hypothetical protein
MEIRLERDIIVENSGQKVVFKRGIKSNRSIPP